MSGARLVPPLIVLAAPHRVREGGVILVTCCIVEAGGTRVLFADPMAMCPTVVPGVRVPSDFTPGVLRVPAVPARALSASFLSVAVSVAMVPVSAKLAAVSYSSTVLSFVAASAKLSRADSSRSMSGGNGAGVTPCAPPSGSPPPEANI